jgi:hypothetical protein
MGYEGGRLEPLFTPELVDRTLREMAKDGQDALYRYAQEFTPVNENPFSSPGRKPGTLRSRWRKLELEHTVARAAPALTGRVENTDPIAPFVENDTRPHIIRPRLDRAPASVIATRRPRRLGDDPQASLRFVTIGGMVIYARVVHHPGTTGHHMMLKALTRVEVEFSGLMLPALIRWKIRQLAHEREHNR